MTPDATVLYEDSMLGPSYPLHELVMRMVEDEIGGETWQLLPRVAGIPKNGVTKLIADVGRTAKIARGGILFLLVDSDRISEHLGLGPHAREDAVIAALRGRSDAPDRLAPYFLHPNVEGLLLAIRRCDEALLPTTMARALGKSLNDRDILFKEAKKRAMHPLRACVRRSQPGLDGLARSLAAHLVRAQTP
jgi:hypothetical protein